MSFTGKHSAQGLGGDIVFKSKDKEITYTDTEIIVGNLNAGDTLKQFTIDIHITYNSSAPKASLGIDLDHEKYMKETDSDLTTIGEYVIEDNVELDVDETIKIYIDPDGATQGELTASIDYA